MTEKTISKLWTDKDVAVNVSKKLGINSKQISETLTLLNDGATIPFIARYRKEVTGALNEVQIHDIDVAAKRVKELFERKESVLKSISEQDKLTKQLQQSIHQATTLQEVEDIYLPYKRKKRTKAMIAREQGLQPLADFVLLHLDQVIPVDQYKNQDLLTKEDVLNGVHEILAEQIGEQAQYRQWLRSHMMSDGVVTSTLKRNGKEKDEQRIYEQYYTFSEPIKTIRLSLFRILAINRGEKEGVLSVKIDFSEERMRHYIQVNECQEQQRKGQGYQLLLAAIADAYKRFIQPAVEREIRQELTILAQNQAIQVFGDNLYHLLMQAPLKDTVIMGFDPGYRTGSKLAIVDGNGNFLKKQVIYPHKPASEKQRIEAKEIFKKLVNEYGVQLIAIGNGTASRESQEFVANHLPVGVQYTIVNEAGASVYSASEIAREEFPQLQVEERSAISIARRVQDPLAELIKIDPKSIGVGQYQHDLNAKALDSQVDHVVESAVNQVGINLNTASVSLLKHIAGLNETLANNIVKYRTDYGIYMSRQELKKVPRLGPKAYEQAAGFLRIIGGQNVLDNTDIHPESYQLADKLLTLANIHVNQLATPQANDKLKRFDNQSTAEQLQVGLATLHDVIVSLQKPGRDGRSDMVGALLKSDVLHIEDIRQGMQLQGTVRNVVDFGAFVDLGVKHDGLVHISKLAKKRIKHPSEIVSVGDIVDVWVVEVDQKRQRISLTMIKPD